MTKSRARVAPLPRPPPRCGAGKHSLPSMPQGAGDGLPQHICRAWHAQFELNVRTLRGAAPARHVNRLMRWRRYWKIVKYSLHILPAQHHVQPRRSAHVFFYKRRKKTKRRRAERHLADCIIICAFYDLRASLSGGRCQGYKSTCPRSWSPGHRTMEGSVLAAKAVETQGKANGLAKAVEAQGKRSVFAAKAMETHHKGGV